MEASESTKICPIVYLAGGFRSEWQLVLRKRLSSFRILDPSQRKHITDADAYTKWDLDAISQCDFLLAYLEASNPGGYALALEIGYAAALGKRILLVEHHPTPERHRYFEMVRTVANHRFDKLEQAVDWLLATDRQSKPSETPKV